MVREMEQGETVGAEDANGMKGDSEEQHTCCNLLRSMQWAAKDDRCSMHFVEDMFTHWRWYVATAS